VGEGEIHSEQHPHSTSPFKEGGDARNFEIITKYSCPSIDEFSYPLEAEFRRFLGSMQRLSEMRAGRKTRVAFLTKLFGSIGFL
jgi:hypothetical protein